MGDYLLCYEYFEDILKILQEEIDEFKDEEIKPEPEPFIITYRSKPIRGTVLELVTMNPEYKVGD